MIEEPLCRGRRCLVVGSAPGVVVPPRASGDIVLGANGGAALAQPCSVLATTAHLFRETPTAQELATRDSLRGLFFPSVWVDEKNGTVGHAMIGLDRLKVDFGTIRGVDPGARERVVQRAIGVGLWVSTGVWAACLALVSGAAHVTLAGISLGRGHEGMDWDADPRYHVGEDRQALQLLERLGVELPPDLRQEVAA